MPSSSSSPDKFQREIDDIIRLAEKRLERESVGYKVRRRTRLVGSSMPRFSFSLPRAEVLGGWGLALLLLSWLMSLLQFGRLMATVMLGAQILGIVCLVAAILISLTSGQRTSGGGQRMWRGERVSYGNPYGANGVVNRIRRLFRG